MKGKTALLLTLLLVCSGVEAGEYCFEQAGIEFQVSPHLLYAISAVESRHRPDAINTNPNNSVDLGHMQINSQWIKKMGAAGWTLLPENPCYCTRVGAWILRQCVERYGNTWDAVACYNCGKSPDELSPELRQRAYAYINNVQRELKKIWPE